MPPRRRPLGITLLAIIIAWCSLGGAFFALVHVVPPPGVPWGLYRLGAALYAVTGLPTAFALWRLAPWASQAFAAWVVCALLASSLPGLTLPGTTGVSRAVLIATLACAGILLWLLYRYVQRSV